MKFIKSFFKYYLPTLIFIGALGIFLFWYMFNNHLPILEFIFGCGTIHSNVADTIVKEDEIELTNAKVFILENGNKLLIYTPDSEKSHDVLIVDKLKNNVGLTNSGKDNYEILFDRFLFQSKNAYRIVYANEGKWALKHNLKISNKDISYKSVSWVDGYHNVVNHEIIFKDK